MSNPITVREMADVRGIHDEELASDAPLAPDALRELMALQAGLYEYLSDESCPGNASARVAGHSHGRDGEGGAYVERFGVFHPGYIEPQQVSGDSYSPVLFTLFGDGGPASSGEENPGTGVRIETPALYVLPDFTSLSYTVCLRASSGTSAHARLSLCEGATVLASDTQSSSASQWTPVRFDLPISNSASFGGWRTLKLQLRSAVSGLTAEIAAADERMKPMPGAIYNGVGLLIGEAP
jgi:hypothetical protein